MNEYYKKLAIAATITAVVIIVIAAFSIWSFDFSRLDESARLAMGIIWAVVVIIIAGALDLIE